MKTNITRFCARAAATLAFPLKRLPVALLMMLTTATAWATTTSAINVGGTDYTLFTGFTATGGNGTNYAKLVDGNTSTDWVAKKSYNNGDPNAPAGDFNGGTDDPAFVEFHADEPIVPKGYVLTCDHENAGFWKPVEWALKAKLNEGDAWATIHSSTTTLGAGKTFEIACTNDGDNSYQYFRFEVYEVGATTLVDLDELQIYGSLPAYTHLTVKAATCTETGIKQDCYRRNSDGKYFTDETGTTELQESDVIAPIIPHTGEHHEATDVNIEYWQCSMCGKYFSDSGYTTEITEEQTKIYRTITIDGSISGLVTCYVSQALAGTTMYLYVSDLIDASTLKVNDGAVELTAVTDIQYTFTMPAADVTVTAEVAQSNADGDILTGSIRHTVTIPDGASITLNNATITGSIVCEGSATITLVGTNSVSGATFKAGIQIGGSGTTLTINGDGSLTANGGSQSAGIGLSRIWNYDSNVTSGDIVIEGGTITATGGNWGAGIGTGAIKNTNNDNSTSVQFGNVTIKGGSVTAIGGDSGDGIGKGYSYPGPAITFGTVTIYDGIDKVDASSIKDFGNVVYMSGESNVTANKADHFTIIEDGDRRIIVPKDDTDYTITIADGIEHGTLSAAETAKYMEMVTVTATPAFGYRLVRLIVKDGENNDVASTGNTFLMPKGNVTVSAEFALGSHGTTEFAWGYFGPSGFVNDATIYDGVTTVNIQTTGQSYNILKYDEYTYYKFLLDNDTYGASIPYAGGTGEFYGAGNGTYFSVPYDGETGYYDITMTDASNGKWSVSIQKTAGQMDVVPDQTYTGSAITPEPTVVAGSLSLTKGTDYTYSYTDNTNVGTATVRATFQGDYASLGYVERTFTIGKGTPTVTAPTAIDDLIYNGSAQALVTTGSTDFGTLLYSLDGNTYAADIPTATDAANYTVYYKVEATDNWNAVDAATVAVSIAAKAVTVTADDQTKEYGQSDPTLTATVEGLIDEDAITYSVSRAEGEAVGEYAITPTGEAAQGNYAVTYVAGTLTIMSNPTLTLTANQAPDENYWTTFYCGDAGYTIDAEENACAYTATVSANVITLHKLGKEIPAGTAVIIVADNNEVSMTEATLSTFSGDNALRGVDVETSTADIQTTLGSGTFYVLGMKNDHFGFHKYEGTEMAARKAFVLVDGDGAALARSLTMVFDDEATGIKTTDFTDYSDSDDAWYTLDGRRLQGKPAKSGIYVNNGKKIVIK